MAYDFEVKKLAPLFRSKRLKFILWGYELGKMHENKRFSKSEGEASSTTEHHSESETCEKSDVERFYENLIPASERYTENDTEYQEYCKQRTKILQPPVIHPWPPCR